MRLLNRVGDRMLAAVLPRTKAGACATWDECHCSSSCVCAKYHCIWCDGGYLHCDYVGSC
jgi:hypothetical protein